MRGKSILQLFSVVLLFLLVSRVAFSTELETAVQEQFMQARVLARQAVVKLDNGLSTIEELAALGELAGSLQVDDLLLQSRFDSRSERLAEFSADIQQRQQSMKHFYAQNVSALHASLASLLAVDQPLTSDFQSLVRLIDATLPAKEYPLFGSLPYQNLNWPLRQPDITAAVTPAYLGGSQDVSAADTANSASAMITPQIAALAESLAWNPVQIYQWVSANIATEWYWGSMKGAAETLRQRSGNDADQAALLIALLRAADFPARYVRGVIEFLPGTEAISELIGIEDPLQQLRFFQKAGIPVKAVIAGGRIVNLQIEHLWVETQVPYANYRGNLLDPSGKSWLALDSSIKPSGYSWNQSLDFDSGFDLSVWRDAYLFNPQTQTPLEFLRKRISEQLVADASSASYEDYLQTRSREEQPLNILPASLQFKPVAITGEFTDLPDQLQHTVTFTATKPDGSPLFAITYNVADLTSRKLSLFFEAESVADQQLINSYGGLRNTPAYLVRLRPLLRVDGQRVIVAEDGLPMGAEFTLDVALHSPGGTQHFSNQHIVGNLAVIGLVAQQALLPEEIPLEQKDAEQLLFAEALRYIDRWNAAEDELASLFKVVMIRPLPTLVTVGGVIDVTWLLDTPHDFSWRGVFIDAGLRRVEVVARAGRQSDARNFMRFAALQGSVLEAQVLEDDFEVAAISTAKLLGLAGQTSASLLTLDSDNIDLLETLDLAENIRQDIVNAVNQGLIVTLPKTEQRYHDWSGSGYLKENPATGEAGYMLSGMIAGASTAAKEWAQIFIRELLDSPFGAESNSDPLAAANITKIPVTDYQIQAVGEELAEPLYVLVTDINGRPVRGAEVTFKVVSGGGSFKDGQNKAITGIDGIAEIRAVLGKRTSSFVDPLTQEAITVATVYKRTEDTDKNVTQMGVNSFSATVASHFGTIDMQKPLTAYGRPGPAEKLLKILGDGFVGLVNTSLGSILVGVVDRYGNPVSNETVTFKVVKELVAGAEPDGIADFRSLRFFDGDACGIANPIFDDCVSTVTAEVESRRIGAVVNTFFGNTMNTEYQLQATLASYDADLNPDGRVTLVQKTAGDFQAGEYLPPQLFIKKLVDVNAKGDPVAAAKVSSQYGKPLTASLIMISNDYTMGPEEVCQEQADPSQTYPCWRIIGSPVIKTEKIRGGTVKFKAVQGGGIARCGSGAADADGWISCQDQTSIDAVEDGLYRAMFTTGPEPLLNWVEAEGEVVVTVPTVYFEDPLTGDARETGYRKATLPMQEITLKSGQKAVFDQNNAELFSKSVTRVDFGVYGIELDGSMVKDYLLLNSVGSSTQGSDASLKINSEKLIFNYMISPPAIGDDPAYEAYSAHLDLFIDDKWFGFIVGDALSAAGTAQIDYGNQWQLGKQYSAEVVLNRGHDGIEIHSDKFPLKLLLADLDIDSDNNAGWHSDGTHSLPDRNLLEDQAEALAGATGKVLPANLHDIDADGVPGFADGIDKFDNQGANASAPFVPVILEIAGDIDLAMVTISFNYAASDPAAITRTGDQTLGYSYEPAPGALRLWRKDGGQSRSVASISTGGDFIAAGQEYSLSDLDAKTADGYWLFWLEGVRPTEAPEQGQISIDVKLSGTLIASDRVQTTVRSLALVPDYNHDRKLDEEDRKRALAGDTYYFWINNDDDSGETGGNDIPGDTALFGELDWDNEEIDGVRDLIDFFPVYLGIHELLQIFSPERYVYKLSNQDAALNFTYTHLDYGPAGNVGDYLIDVATARNYGNKEVYKVKPAGVSLRKDFLLFAQQDENKGVLLFEGSKKTAEPLVLMIYDGAGKQVFRQSLNLSLDGVEQMFRHKNLIQAIGDTDAPLLENADIGKSETKGGEIDRIGQPSNYPDAESSNEYAVWVHGFNVNGQQVRGWHAEMFKRLYWSGSKARFVGVSWYGFERQPIDYHSNVVHAFETAETIGAQLKTMVADNPVTFLAHSLGNLLVSSYLSDHYRKSDQALNVKNYIMLNSAVALEAYLGDYEQYGDEDNLSLPFGSTNTMVHSKWSDYERRFGSSEWYQHFKDVLVDGEQDNRYYLTWRNRFGDLPTDTINTISFYSTGEDVLATFTGDGPRLFNDLLTGDFGRNSWVIQEKWKGRWPFNHWGGTTLMGWGFTQEDYQGWDDWDVETEVDIDATRLLTPAEVSAQVSNIATLRTEPFFRKPVDRGAFLDSMLLNPEKVGSDYAAANRDRLLALGLPALTTAAGGWGGEDIRKKQYTSHYNMDENKNDWPAIRGDLKGWFHSDIKVVAFPFTHEVIKKIIQEGRLQ